MRTLGVRRPLVGGAGRPDGHPERHPCVLRPRRRAGAVRPGCAPLPLTVGPGPCDGWELTLPAATRVLSDPDRKLPTGREPVAGTDVDFRTARPIGDLAVDHAFTDLTRDGSGHTTVELRDPATGHAVGLWVDGAHPWLMVFTADDDTPAARRAVAVEPMTAQADAFRSGEDLVWLAPGETFSASWGIRALS